VSGADGSAPVPVDERVAVFDNDGHAVVREADADVCQAGSQRPRFATARRSAAKCLLMAVFSDARGGFRTCDLSRVKGSRPVALRTIDASYVARRPSCSFDRPIIVAAP
jgi:hypothetical protein